MPPSSLVKGHELTVGLN